MTGQPWSQGYVPRYGCGTFVLVWLYTTAANVLLVWLGQWPGWSAGFAATAAGACFGCAVLSASNSRDRRDWDRKHPQQERRPMFDGDEDGWTPEQHQRADDDEEF